MPTIVLNGRNDFVTKCKELGAFNAYISFEKYENKEAIEGLETAGRTVIITVARLTAYAQGILITNMTQIDKVYKEEQASKALKDKQEGKDIEVSFMKELQDKAGDKLVFTSGVVMI